MPASTTTLKAQPPTKLRNRIRATLAVGSALTILATAATVGATLKPLVFKGNGGKTLAPFKLKHGTTLHWTNNGLVFQIFDKAHLDNYVPVNSQAHRGSTYISAGRHTFQVNAVGAWTIRIKR